MCSVSRITAQKIMMLDDDVDIDGLDDEEEVEMEKIDLSVPDGVSIEDPVRMYLKGDRQSSASYRRRGDRTGKENGSRAMRMPRSVWQRPTCVWLSALQSVMWDVECFSLI